MQYSEYNNLATLVQIPVLAVGMQLIQLFHLSFRDGQ